MDRPWKVIFAFVGVFIAGAIFGGVFTRGVAVRRNVNATPQRPVVQLPATNQPQPQVAGPQNPGQNAPAVRFSPITPHLMRRLTQKLNLTPEQQKKIKPVVSRAGEDLDRIRQENGRRNLESIADTRRTTERMYADVSEILTIEQRVELEQMRKQEHERAQAERQKRIEAAQAASAALEAANKAATPPSTRPNTTPPGTP
jgi:hypothetical protein